MINNNKMTKEEALAIAKTWNFLKDKNKEALETLVPELQPQESEDEKIRKALFDLVKSKESEGYMVFHNVYIGSMLDWLEKQNERKPVLIIPKFRIGDEIKTSNEKSLTITKIDEKGYWSEELFICDFDEECLWELVEQKPTDKVEQKFKIKQDTWYICTCTTCSEDSRIWFKKGTVYLGKEILKYDLGFEPNDYQDYFRPWTIEDAKDGDILAEDSCIFIIQKLGDNSTAAKTYCTI